MIVTSAPRLHHRPTENLRQNHTFWVNRFIAVQENLGVEADRVGGKLTDLADYVLAKA